jgi:hypothetical protein
MLSEPAAWKRLLGKLVTVQADYLLAQAAGRARQRCRSSTRGPAARSAGADYLRYVAPHNPASCFARSQRAGVP